MKRTFRMLAAALLIASSASAQRYSGAGIQGEYEPTVYLISAYKADGSGDCCAAREAAALNRLAADAAVVDYLETHRYGFQQVERPQFVFASKNNRFSLALGGSISLRATYDFDGIADNANFMPSAIPVPGNYDTRQQLGMDASASRLFVKAIANSRALGRVVIFADADFRGGDRNSYTPRLRSAYVSLLGLTLGRDVTTFNDLRSAPEMIDLRGPNSNSFEKFATVARYEVTFANDRLTFGVAAEMPDVDATYNANFASLRQRMPDFPAYIQLAWGDSRESHIRASGIVRNMYLHNNLTDKNTSLLGWGAQFSGRIKVAQPLVIYMNGVYGEGIAPYISDLAGSGLDFTPNPQNAEQVQTMPMWGWQASAQINLSRRVKLSGGYSTVRVERKHGAVADDQYRQGDYIFGNIFCSVTPRMKIAAEYIYGERSLMGGARNHANRVSILAQYNF